MQASNALGHSGLIIIWICNGNGCSKSFKSNVIQWKALHWFSCMLWRKKTDKITGFKWFSCASSAGEEGFFFLAGLGEGTGQAAVTSRNRENQTISSWEFWKKFISYWMSFLWTRFWLYILWKSWWKYWELKWLNSANSVGGRTCHGWCNSVRLVSVKAFHYHCKVPCSLWTSNAQERSVWRVTYSWG